MPPRAWVDVQVAGVLVFRRLEDRDQLGPLELPVEVFIGGEKIGFDVLALSLKLHEKLQIGEVPCDCLVKRQIVFEGPLLLGKGVGLGAIVPDRGVLKLPLHFGQPALLLFQFQVPCQPLQLFLGLSQGFTLILQFHGDILQEKGALGKAPSRALFGEEFDRGGLEGKKERSLEIFQGGPGTLCQKRPEP